MDGLAIRDSLASSSAADLPLIINGLTKRFGHRTAVDDLSVTIRAGTVTGFLGPNGAGKTTTLRILAGLLQPTAGSARLFGIDSGRPEARLRLGYMPADPSFLAHLSGAENLDLLAALHRSVPVDRSAVAHQLGLPRSDLARRVGDYSSGMRQKLAIVAALQHRPELVVLDEPANRLDPLAHHAFCDVVRAVAAVGRTVLLSSHVLAEVESVCDQVVMIRNGRLLRFADVRDLRRQASREIAISYVRPPDSLPAGLIGGCITGATVTGRIPARNPDLIRSLLRDPTVVDLTIVAASLEDVFLDLYQGQAS